MVSKKALFLDRDGVINIDHGYIYKIEDFIFVDGIFDFVKYFYKLDYKIIVITNQSGIGRGLYKLSDYNKLTKYMCNSFKNKGIEITKVYKCPHHPIFGKGSYKVDCKNRKPNPGMILQALEDYNIDPTKSILVGDSLTDIQAGLHAKLGKNFLLNTKNIKVDSENKKIIKRSLYICKKFSEIQTYLDGKENQ